MRTGTKGNARNETSNVESELERKELFEVFIGLGVGFLFIVLFYCTLECLKRLSNGQILISRSSSDRREQTSRRRSPVGAEAYPQTQAQVRERLRTPTPIPEIALETGHNEELLQLPEFYVKGDGRLDLCGICLEPIGDSLASAGECLHLFHATCITSWLHRNAGKTCPICRHKFSCD